MLLCNCLVGALPYSHYVMRSFPLCGVRVLHPPHYVVYSITIMVTAKKQQKRYLGCLAHAVIGMLYSVVANQRQPQYTHNVLQRRCQPRPTTTVDFKGGGVLHENIMSTSIATHARMRAEHSAARSQYHTQRASKRASTEENIET